MRRLLLGLGILSLLSLGSCVSKKKMAEMTKQRDLFFEEKEKAEKALARARSMNDSLLTAAQEYDRDRTRFKNDLIELQGEYDRLKKECDELQKAYEGKLKSNKSEAQKLLQELNDKENRLRQLEDDLRLREKRVKELEDILQAQRDAVTQLRDKLLKALKGYTDKGLNVYEKDGRVYVSMDEKLLFASGKTEVNRDGQMALTELGKVLESDPSLQVVVEGHTDNVPLSGSGPIKDNWELSVLRAASVTKILLENRNIDPKRITPAGRGEFIPVGTNETKEGRAKNRRTEIIIEPRLDELMKLIKGE
ncbi:MAG: OmpA family protein [Bacteroidia bacterium]|nr:OmpA family protein [Bacteroidia bacterium]